MFLFPIGAGLYITLRISDNQGWLSYFGILGLNMALNAPVTHPLTVVTSQMPCFCYVFFFPCVACIFTLQFIVVGHVCQKAFETLAVRSSE